MTPEEKDKTAIARRHCRFKYAMGWLQGGEIVYYAKCGLRHGQITGWDCRCSNCRLYQQLEKLIEEEGGE